MMTNPPADARRHRRYVSIEKSSHISIIQYTTRRIEEHHHTYSRLMDIYLFKATVERVRQDRDPLETNTEKKNTQIYTTLGSQRAISHPSRFPIELCAASDICSWHYLYPPPSTPNARFVSSLAVIVLFDRRCTKKDFFGYSLLCEFRITIFMHILYTKRAIYFGQWFVVSLDRFAALTKLY